MTKDQYIKRLEGALDWYAHNAAIIKHNFEKNSGPPAAFKTLIKDGGEIGRTVLKEGKSVKTK